MGLEVDKPRRPSRLIAMLPLKSALIGHFSNIIVNMGNQIARRVPGSLSPVYEIIDKCRISAWLGIKRVGDCENYLFF